MLCKIYFIGVDRKYFLIVYVRDFRYKDII